MKTLLVFFITLSLYALPAMADCVSAQPAKKQTLLVSACQATSPKDLQSHIDTWMGKQTIAGDLFKTHHYAGSVIAAQLGEDQRTFFLAEHHGTCEQIKLGQPLVATIGQACCDGDPNAPCYLGLSEFLVLHRPDINPVTSKQMTQWFDYPTNLTHRRLEPGLNFVAPQDTWFSDHYSNYETSQTQIQVMLLKAGKFTPPFQTTDANPSDAPVGQHQHANRRITTFGFTRHQANAKTYGALTRLTDNHDLLVQMNWQKNTQTDTTDFYDPSFASLQAIMPKIEQSMLSQLAASQKHPCKRRAALK